MGKLTFVGLGLGSKGTSLEGVMVIKAADHAYLEYYTSPHEATLLEELERASGKKMSVVDRVFVEDGARLLEQAKTLDVVLCVQGDPMLATTHTELRVRAIKAGIQTRIIHGATILSAAVSVSGLHVYKFGKTITFPREAASRNETYRTVHRNLVQGLHTLLLMEFDVEKNEGVTPVEIFGGLLAAESSLKRNAISDDTFALVLSRIGWDDGRVVGGGFSELIHAPAGKPPQCVIIPGALHFTELEALAAITSLKEGVISHNTKNMLRTAQVLVPRYVEKTKKALKRAREGLNGVFPDLLENAELYMKDAERFLANGEDELAMLSVGYAEGLLDSLTFTNKFDLGW